MELEKASFVTVGGNEESRVALQALLKAGCPVRGAVILPPESARSVSDYVPLEKLCEEHDVPYIATEDINAPEVIDWLAGRKTDHLFVLGWSQIISRDVRDLFSGLCVGSHPTPLPLRKGRAPIPWTILEGHPSSAVSLFRLEDRVDSGAILVQIPFELGKRPYAREVYDLAADALGRAYVSLHASLASGRVPEVDRSGVQPSMRGKRVAADGLIDFSDSPESIDRLVRAVSEPYPGAYFYYRDRRITAWRADLHDGLEYRGVIGQVLTRGEKGVLVQARGGQVWLNRFTCDGEPVDTSLFRLGDTLNHRIEDHLFQLERRISNLESRLDEL